MNSHFGLRPGPQSILILLAAVRHEFSFRPAAAVNSRFGRRPPSIPVLAAGRHKFSLRPPAWLGGGDGPAAAAGKRPARRTRNNPNDDQRAIRNNPNGNNPAIIHPCNNPSASDGHPRPRPPAPLGGGARLRRRHRRPAAVPRKNRKEERPYATAGKAGPAGPDRKGRREEKDKRDGDVAIKAVMGAAAVAEIMIIPSKIN